MNNVNLSLTALNQQVDGQDMYMLNMNGAIAILTEDEVFELQELGWFGDMTDWLKDKVKKAGKGIAKGAKWVKHKVTGKKKKAADGDQKDAKGGA
jgi:hypothetical protein